MYCEKVDSAYLASMPMPLPFHATCMTRSSVLRGAILLSALMAGCSTSAETEQFYEPDGQAVSAQANVLLRHEKLEESPHGASAYRVLYRSQDAEGRPIAVSGLVIVPPGPAPAGKRPVVAWAHPTTGVVPKCAPSRSVLRFVMIPGLKDMLAQGYVVTATDYPGTAAGQVQPFLDGPAEARAVLDSVRAAQALPDASAGDRVVLWGHSQGGQASLFAANMAQEYAPELQVQGVAVAAPATNLAKLFSDDLGTTGGNNLSALALWAWSKVKDAPYEGIVHPESLAAIDTIANECISLLPEPAKRKADKVLSAGFLLSPDLSATEPWRSLIRDNSAGLLPPKLPTYIAQGDADVIVQPTVTRGYAARLCHAGSAVTFDSITGVGHGGIGMKSAPTAVAWMADRFAGNPAPDQCANLLQEVVR